MQKAYSRKKLIQDLIFIFIIGLTPLLWFKKGYIVNGPDVSFPLEPLRFLFNRFFTWNHINGTGLDATINITTIFFHSVQGLLYFITRSMFWTQKLSYCFWFTLNCLSIYYFSVVIQKNKPDRLGRWIIILIYAFNPFVFNIWEVAKAAELSALAVVPLLLAFLIQGLDGRLSFFKASFYSALVSLMFSEIGASPSVLAIPIGICVGYFIFYVFVEIFRRVGLKRIFSLFGFFFLFVFLYTLFNLFWILPYYFEIFKTLVASSSDKALEAFNMTDWLGGISTHTSILNVSRFQGAWDWYYSWYDEPYVAYANTYFKFPFMLIMSIALPAFAYTALIFKRNRNIIFFSLIALIGTLFSTGAHPPFGKIFLWIAENIPVFMVFRSPYYKFSLATLFAYAYLISVSISTIYRRCKVSEKFKSVYKNSQGRQYKVFPVVIVLVFVISYLAYNFPMINGKIIPVREKLFSLHLQVPDYVFEADNWLNEKYEKEEPFRLMSLPRENLDTYRWGYGSPTNLLNLINSVPVVWGKAVEFSGENKIRDLFYEQLYNGIFPNIQKLLQMLNVKYIWLRNDCWYDFYGSKVSPQDLKEKVELMDDITLSKTIGKWDFFELDSTASLIDVPKENFLIYGDVDVLCALANRHELNSSVFIFNEEGEQEKISYLLEKDAVQNVVFYNYAPDKMRQEIESKFKNKNLNYHFVYSTPKLSIAFREKISLPEGVKVVKKLGFSEPMKLRGDEGWQWLFTNKQPNIIVQNSNDEEKLLNFAFDVRSYYIDRTIYVYLNDELLEVFSLKADENTTLRLKKLYLAPGRNEISFYTPYSAERWRGRPVSFAFKNFWTGALLFKGDFFIPQKATYRIDAFPYFLNVVEKNDLDFSKGKKFILDGEVFNLEEIDKYHLHKGNISLEKGVHTFRIDQFATEDYYIEISEEPKDTSTKPGSIDFQKRNPTKYKIDLKEAQKQPYFLLFNEAYNKNWKLYSKGKMVSARHLKANGYANAWYVEDEVEEFFVEYTPQHLFYLASIISVVSILVIGGSFLWLRKKKR